MTVKSVIDLSIEVTDASDTQGQPGTVSWTITNTGTGGETENANNVYVVVELPVGTIPQDMATVPNGWSCQIQENPINKVTCHGNLAGGGSAELHGQHLRDRRPRRRPTATSTRTTRSSSTTTASTTRRTG